MSWYNTQGPSGDHVLFSKVRYIRNIAKQSFYPLADAKRGSEAFSRLDSILQKNGFRGERLGGGITPQILSLAEKQFVESDFVYSDKPRALYLNEPCNLIVSLGGENYINITSVISGANIGEARNMASGAEELIDREISFAYTEGIGYLSPSPSDCGSGVELSSALYLPSLRLSDVRDTLFFSLSALGMSLRPMFTTKENEGDLYILSYKPHYLSCEESATEHFARTVSLIVENEKRRLCMITKNIDKNIFNSARRALGVLLYSDTLSEQEMLRLFSEIRLCLSTSESGIDSLPKIQSINYLTAEGLSASTVVSAKEKCESHEECDKARAALVKEYIQHKNEVKNVK